MGTLELKDCKEVFIFKTMTEHERFLDACKAVMAFDKEHPDKKILKGSVDKEVLRMCFTECRNAVAIAFRKGERPDFSNISHLNRLKNVYNQQLPKACQKPHDNFTSLFRGKIEMGINFLDHLEYVGRAGLKYYKSLISEEKREASKRTYEQATVGKYRQLEHGYDNGKVFSSEKQYKTNQEVIYERLSKERASKRFA